MSFTLAAIIEEYIKECINSIRVNHFMFIYIALHFFGNTKSIFVVVVVVVVVVVMYDL